MTVTIYGSDNVQANDIHCAVTNILIKEKDRLTRKQREFRIPVLHRPKYL